MKKPILNNKNKNTTKHNQSNSRMNLVNKKNLIKSFLDSNISIAEYSRVNKVSARVLKYNLDNKENLLNIHSDDDFFLEKKNLKSSEKYGPIDNFIKESIGSIRSKGGIATKSIIIALAKQFIKKEQINGITINDYFIRRFLKGNDDVFHNTLHGEAKSASTESLENFFNAYSVVASDYDEENIFNMDESGLFIKNIGNKTFTISKKDNKNIKLDKIRITVGLLISRVENS